MGNASEIDITRQNAEDILSTLNSETDNDGDDMFLEESGATDYSNIGHPFFTVIESIFIEEEAHNVIHTAHVGAKPPVKFPTVQPCAINRFTTQEGYIFMHAYPECLLNENNHVYDKNSIGLNNI